MLLAILILTTIEVILLITIDDIAEGQYKWH